MGDGTYPWVAGLADGSRGVPMSRDTYWRVMRLTHESWDVLMCHGTYPWLARPVDESWDVPIRRETCRGVTRHIHESRVVTMSCKTSCRVLRRTHESRDMPRGHEAYPTDLLMMWSVALWWDLLIGHETYLWVMRHEIYWWRDLLTWLDSL